MIHVKEKKDFPRVILVGNFWNENILKWYGQLRPCIIINSENMYNGQPDVCILFRLLA